MRAHHRRRSFLLNSFPLRPCECVCAICDENTTRMFILEVLTLLLRRRKQNKAAWCRKMFSARLNWSWCVVFFLILEPAINSYFSQATIKFLFIFILTGDRLAKMRINKSWHSFYSIFLRFRNCLSRLNKWMTRPRPQAYPLSLPLSLKHLNLIKRKFFFFFNGTWCTWFQLTNGNQLQMLESHTIQCQSIVWI